MRDLELPPLAFASCHIALLGDSRGSASAPSGSATLQRPRADDLAGIDASTAPEQETLSYHYIHAVPTSHPGLQEPAPSSSHRTRHRNHASHAVSCSPPGGGLILARVVEEGYALELRTTRLGASAADDTTASSTELQLRTAASAVSFIPPDSSGLAAPTTAPGAASSASSHDRRPALFLFPAPLLPEVGIFADPLRAALHVLVVTTTGYLFRLSFALPHLFHSAVFSYNWAGEHRISSISPSSRSASTPEFLRRPTLANVLDQRTVLVSCTDGTLVKIELDGGASEDGELQADETVLRPTSFLAGVTRFFTRAGQHATFSFASVDDKLDSGPISPQHALSIASYLPEDDTTSPLAFAVSRDRKIRVWDLVAGSCVRTIDLPLSTRSTSHSTAVVAAADVGGGAGGSGGEASGTSLGGDGHSFVLVSRPVLRVVIAPPQDASDYASYLIVFVPAPPPTGNFFVMYGIQLERRRGAAGGGGAVGTAAALGDIVLLWEAECDRETRGISVELRDVCVHVDSRKDDEDHVAWRLWSLWDNAGASLLKHITATQVQPGKDEAEIVLGAWHTVSTRSPYSPLFGADFGASLQQVEDPAQLGSFFLSRIWEAGRFGEPTVDAALDAYEDLVLRSLPEGELPPYALSAEARFADNRQRMLSVVACHVRLQHDAVTGAPRHEAHMAAVRREWLKFVEVLEDLEASARYPLTLAVDPEPSQAAGASGGTQIPFVVLRERLALPYLKDSISVMLDVAATRDRQAQDGPSSDHNPQIGDAASIPSPTLAAASGPAFTRVLSLLRTLNALVEALSAAEIDAVRRNIDAVFSAPLTLAVEDVAEEIYAGIEDGVIDSVLEELAKGCRSLGSDLEPALWELLDLLVESPSWTSATGAAAAAAALPTETRSESSSTHTLAGAALTADAMYQGLAVRQHVAMAMSLSLVLLATSLGEVADEIVTLRSLLARALTVAHAVESLRCLADEDPAVDLHAHSLLRSERGPGSDGGQEGGGEADAIARRLGQMTIVRSEDAVKREAAKLDRAVATAHMSTMLQRCLFAGLLPVMPVSHGHDYKDEDDEADTVGYGVDGETQRARPRSLPEVVGWSATLALTGSGLLHCRREGDAWRSEPSATLPTLRSASATLAHRLLVLGQPRSALAYVSHWPSGPARAYIRGLALLATGDYDAAKEDLLSIVPLLGAEHLDDDAVQGGRGVDDDEEAGDVLGLDALLLLLPQIVFEAEGGRPYAQSSLPTARGQCPDARFLRHVALLFDEAGSPLHAIAFGVLALQAATSREGQDFAKESANGGASADISRPRDCFPLAESRDLWFRVFHAQLALRELEGAYATVMAMPHESLRRDCVRSLVATLCETGQVSALLGFAFPGLQPEIERTLSFKARNSDPLATPNYYRILYAYHMHRGDLKSAGAVMYQHAHRLARVQRHTLATSWTASAQTADTFVDLAVLQARSYLAAINALSLVGAENAWFADALADDEDEGQDAVARAGARAGSGVGGGSALTHYLPEALFQPSCRRLRIVQLSDLRREYGLVLAYLELLSSYPEFARAPATLDAANAVLLYARSGDFDRAMATGRSLGVDLTAVFQSLTAKCVALARAMAARRAEEKRDPSLAHPALRALREEDDGEDEDALDLADLSEDEVHEVDTATSRAADLRPEAAFLNTSERSAGWSGSVDERAWRYLNLHLDVHDGAATQHRYRTAVLERVLDLDARDIAPAWLWQWFKANKPDLLIRACMKSGQLDDALQHAIDMVEDSTRNELNEQPALRKSPGGDGGRGKSGRSWLPYSLLDSLLVSAEDPSSRPSRGSPSATHTRQLCEGLRSALARRVERLESLDTNMRRREEEDEARRRREKDRRWALEADGAFGSGGAMQLG